MSIFSDIGHLLTLQKVRDKLSHTAGGQVLLTVVFGLLGLILTSIVAQVTAACPGLEANVGAILTAAAGGAIAYLLKSPPHGAWAVVTGVAGAGFAGLMQQVQTICGATFIHQLPTLAMAGVWIGLSHYLQAPSQAPPAK